MITSLLALLSAAVLSACQPGYPDINPITYGDGYMAVQLSTDKAAYAPGEPVQFTLNSRPSGDVRVRYRHLGETLEEQQLGSTHWTWQPPQTDFRGYMVDLYSVRDGIETILGSIAVDVSSDPKVFPRNGFLSYYDVNAGANIDKVIANLNRHHINYVQYQDWHYKHHMPLAGSPMSPMSEWTDVASRVNQLSTVQGYIDATHRHGMKSLFYNLAYGALSDAAADGVREDWYLFTDRNRVSKDLHLLGAPFKSSIFLVNPLNQGWIDYIAEKNSDLYAVFAFDGYQIDQLGGRGSVYDYFGEPIDLASTFNNFIGEMKRVHPTKRLVMNAVGQYGQSGIASAPVDFLYTEVWDKGDYSVLSKVITDNDAMAADGQKTVLAAYMNYGLSQSRGYMNTPGVLMTNAVIHAWGGAHLELGEHMLCNEYFPNNNRTMDGDLQKAMVVYYDFITAYENLLRDGGDWVGVDAVSPSGKAVLNQWSPQLGKVATVGKQFDERMVVHLLNYVGALHLYWDDFSGTQTEPRTITALDVTLTLPDTKRVKSVWMATPDAEFGVAHSLAFTQTGADVTVTIPWLKYWDMVVLEYE